MSNIKTLQRLTLIATILGSSIGFLDATVVSVALPTIAKDLDLGLSGILWVNLAYQLALASLLLVAGSIGDIFGQRRVFCFSVAMFAVASLAVGLAPDVTVMVPARVLQGVAGAFLTTTSLALLRITFEEDSGKAVGLWTSGTTLATIVGPIAGGAIINFVSWRWIFLINIPICVIAILFAIRGRTAHEAPLGARVPLDTVGAFLGAVSIVALTFGLVQQTGPENQQAFANVLVYSLIVSLIFGALFVWWEGRTKHPMLPLTLFRARNFSWVNLTTFFAYAGLGGAMFFLGLFVQAEPMGLSPFVAGFVGLPIGLFLTFLTPIFGKFTDKHGPRLLLFSGPLLMAGASSLWLLLGSGDRDASTPLGNMTILDLFWLFSGMVIFGIGLAILVAPITVTALRAAPTRYSGVASGVNTAVARIGSLVASAVMGVVAAGVYSSNRTATDTPFAVNLPRAQFEHSIDAFRYSMLIAIGCLVAGAIAVGIGVSNSDALSAGSKPSEDVDT